MYFSLSKVEAHQFKHKLEAIIHIDSKNKSLGIKGRYVSCKVEYVSACIDPETVELNFGKFNPIYFYSFRIVKFLTTNKVHGYKYAVKIYESINSEEYYPTDIRIPYERFCKENMLYRHSEFAFKKFKEDCPEYFI